MSDVIHLEGFESSIRGKKVWVVGDDSLALRRLNLSVTESLGRGRTVCITDSHHEMSQQIFQKLSDTTTTVIGVGSRSHVPVQPWNVIFFPHDMNSQQIEEMLLSRVGQNKLRSMNLRSILPELKTAKASLVWSTIDETERAGSLYWFDTMDGQPPEELWNPMETSMFLHDLADRIASAK